MKKGLSLVAAAALAFSTFSSAFAAEATLDTQGKFDALKAKGIFEGRENGPELDKTMTRAEFAKVIVKLLGLQENASGASVYTDLDGATWAKGYIGAVTPKYMDGVATGKFDPSGTVTKEQLATILVRALGLQVDANAKVDGKVSDWAKGYVAAAVKAGIVKNDSDFTQVALRSELVESTYASVDKVPQVVGEKASAVTEAKQTGGKTITVKLDGKVADTTKAKFAVTLNGADVEVDSVKWADNKASAEVNLKSKLKDATYVVTLSGVDGLDAAKAKAEVKAEAEKITKIDFVTASEVIPIAEKVRLDFKVINQFGEDAQIPASQLKIRVGTLDDEDWKTVAGASAIELNTDAKDDTKDNKYDRNDRVSITLTHEDSQVSVNKIFTIGDDQIVSKVEIGKLLDSAGNETDHISIGDYAYLQVTAYDQYGFRVVDKAVLADDINFSGDDLSEGTADGNEDVMFNDDVDNDNFPDLKFYADDDATIGDHTITLYTSGGSASKVVKVGGSSEPAAVEFGSVDLNLAENDGETYKDADGNESTVSSDSTSVNYKKYVPIVVKNADGGLLTKDEIVAAAEKGKFNIDESGSAFDVDKNSNTYDGIVKSGPYKGQIALKNLKKGSGTLTVELDDYPDQKASINLYVADKRKVEELRITSDDGDKGMYIDLDGDGVIDDGETAEAAFTVTAYDNNDAIAKDAVYNKRYVVAVSFTNDTNEADGAYLAGDAKFFGSYADAKADSNRLNRAQLTVNQTVYSTLAFLSGEEIDIENGKLGTNYKVKVELYDTKNSDTTSKWVKLDEVTKDYEVVGDKNDTYTWSAYVDKAVKSGDRVLIKNISNLLPTNNATVLANTYGDAGKRIKLTAKDGNTTVLLPNNFTSVTSSNTAYLIGAINNEKKAYVFGLNDKQSSATVTFKTNKGYQTASVSFQGSNNDLVIDKIYDGKIVREVANLSEITSSRVFDSNMLDEIIAHDATFGNEFSKEELGVLAPVHGIQYVVTEAEGVDISNVHINASTGYITFDDVTAVDETGYITIQIVAPSGVTTERQLGWKSNDLN